MIKRVPSLYFSLDMRNPSIISEIPSPKRNPNQNISFVFSFKIMETLNKKTQNFPFSFLLLYSIFQFFIFSAIQYFSEKKNTYFFVWIKMLQAILFNFAVFLRFKAQEKGKFSLFSSSFFPFFSLLVFEECSSYVFLFLTTE